MSCFDLPRRLGTLTVRRDCGECGATLEFDRQVGKYWCLRCETVFSRVCDSCRTPFNGPTTTCSVCAKSKLFDPSWVYPESAPTAARPVERPQPRTDVAARPTASEASAPRDFVDELAACFAGERIRDCIQCGTCSGSCPVSSFMDNPPRRLLAMIRAGMREEVLSSQSLWLCSSCYLCAARCPRQIAITDLICELKRLAIAEGKAEGTRARILASTFAAVVDHRGRSFEPELLIRYWLKASPLSILKKGPLGMRLFRRGRLPLAGQQIRRTDELGTLIAKSKEIGG
ncbi:MAG TPA: 4Fe-4S dicluster domain-containing protein [Anaeromyxobacteraceae bacterium]|nr:4Fe-4S dicluster domain-containing protein [Anaeromyxobacteraceae bacterium]